MTRKEQIQQAEHKYSEDTMFDGCDYIGQVAKSEAFIAGANWADEHPDEESHKKEIKKILKILNEYFSIGDGGQIWLENEKDYENVANQIIEIEKLYY
jgi:hypothetical protein